MRVALLVTGILLLPSAAAIIVKQPCGEEVERAKSTLSKIYQQWPLRPTLEPASAALQTFTTNLATRSGETDGRQWRTHVIRDSKLNAFSVGDGHVFVTEGMLRYVKNDAQLAAVLAHEFAHQIAGHFCQRSSKPGLVGRLFGRKREAQDDQQNVGSLSASTDPQKEEEADRIGVVILERARYDPGAAVLLAARISTTGVTSHAAGGGRLEYLQSFLRDRASMHWDDESSSEFSLIHEILDAEHAAQY